MKQILILGAGTGGTIIANKLRAALHGQPWWITVVDQDPLHLYQPGLLFIPRVIHVLTHAVSTLNLLP